MKEKKIRKLSTYEVQELMYKRRIDERDWRKGRSFTELLRIVNRPIKRQQTQTS